MKQVIELKVITLVDVGSGVMWSLMWEETREPGENPRVRTVDRHDLLHTPRQGSNLGCSGGKREANCCAICKSLLLELFLLLHYSPMGTNLQYPQQCVAM